MTDAHPEFEELIAEAGWLERLALHLTRDPSAAADLSQETLLAALETGASGGIERPRAWLGTLARRLAGAARRRATRDGDAAAARASHREGTAPPADEVVERLELQRLVAGALLELDEPYRGTLHALYFRGERAEELARRSGLPAGTVRWRAARGRELLRDLLAHRSGRTWDRLALQLAPLGVTLPSAAVGAARPWIPLMTLKTIVAGAVAGAALALVADASLAPSRTSAPEVPPAARAGGASRPVQRAPGLVEVESQTSRTVRSAVAVPAGLRFARGRVRSAEGGAPVQGASLRFTRGDEERAATVERDAWAIEGLAPGTWKARVTRDGFAPLEVTLEIPEDALLEHPFTMVPTGTVAVSVRGPGGPLPEFLGSPIPTEQLLSVRARNDAGEEVARWHGRTDDDPLPAIPPDAAGELLLDAAPPLTLELCYGTRVVDTMRLARAADVLTWVVDVERLTRAERAVSYSFVDGNGQRAEAWSWLRPLPADGRGGGRVARSAQVNLRLPPGQYLLEIIAEGADHPRRTIEVLDADLDLGALGPREGAR